MSQRYYFQQYAQRFLEQESNSVSVKKEAPVQVALVYPNCYRVGMASLGFQTVYRILNEHPLIKCERVFLYDPPFNTEIRTLESGKKLDQFDVVGFSLSFETDIINVLGILKRCHFPLLSHHRSDAEPIIMIGGVVSGLNPSPLLSFMDGLLIGEGEGILFQIADTLSRWIQTDLSRKGKLNTLSKIPGVYIPGISESGSRHIQFDLESHPVYTPVVTPLSHFKNMFVVEAARGCRRGCHFCAARQVYAPFRAHSIESILDTIRTKNKGARKVGLEGAGLSDYRDLEKLCDLLIIEGFQVSFSSIRADRVTPELIAAVNRSGARSFTIAPEAGTERLRERIGKPISNETLFKTAGLLGSSEIQILKLYYLIGCPGETEEDVDAIVHLSKELTKIFKSRSKRKSVRVSVNAFVPKPFTVFQWAPMATEKELSRKRKSIRYGLSREKEISFVNKSTREEVLQGILSLGGVQVGLALMDAVEKDIPWKDALRERNIDLEKLLHRERTVEEELPWDFLDYPTDRSLLWEQYQKAVKSHSQLL